jgi:hypothetical protein
MITPKTWSLKRDEKRKNDMNKVKDIIKKYSFYLNLDECAKHFKGIGSTFSYYICYKSENEKNCRVKTNKNEFNINLKDVEFFPIDFNLTTISILDKFYHKPFLKKYNGKVGIVGDLNDFEDDEFIYPVQYTLKYIKYSNKKHHLQNKKKIIFSDLVSSKTGFAKYDNGICGPCYRGPVYLVDNEKEGMFFIQYINSKIFRFIIKEQQVNAMFLNSYIESNIPKIDLTRTWTDEELYEHFDLTDEEIKYIEETVK